MLFYVVSPFLLLLTFFELIVVFFDAITGLLMLLFLQPPAYVLYCCSPCYCCFILIFSFFLFARTLYVCLYVTFVIVDLPSICSDFVSIVYKFDRILLKFVLPAWLGLSIAICSNVNFFVVVHVCMYSYVRVYMDMCIIEVILRALMSQKFSYA